MPSTKRRLGMETVASGKKADVFVLLADVVRLHTSLGTFVDVGEPADLRTAVLHSHYRVTLWSCSKSIEALTGALRLG